MEYARLLGYHKEAKHINHGHRRRGEAKGIKTHFIKCSRNFLILEKEIVIQVLQAFRIPNQKIKQFSQCPNIVKLLSIPRREKQ
jgi:hypothetical protein